MLERCDFLLAFVVDRIREPRIDKKNIAAWRNDFKGRLAIPGELRLHANHKIEKIPPGKGDEENDKGRRNVKIRMTKHEEPWRQCFPASSFDIRHSSF